MKSEQGHVVVFTALMMGTMMLVGSLVAHVAGAADTQARAQTAADAAALAGVQAGRPAAEVAAVHNAARLVGYEARGGEVSVIVDMGGRDARATAAVRGGLG